MAAGARGRRSPSWRRPGLRRVAEALRAGHRLLRAPRCAGGDVAPAAAGRARPAAPRRDRLVVLEDLIDHTNVGAVFRGAAGLGVDAVLLSPRCATRSTDGAVEVSMGAVLRGAVGPAGDVAGRRSATYGTRASPSWR